MKKTRIFVCIIFITVLVSLLSGCVARVPIPEIKEGRFDFSVTYEINGTQTTYTGVYVCKYDGVYITCVGKGIEWEGYIENEKDEDVAIQTNEDGVIYINFGFFPEYFMGDPSAEFYSVPEPCLYMIYHGDDPDSLDITSEEDVISGYGVRLISYEYADPIENSFEEKLSFGHFEPSIN